MSFRANVQPKSSIPIGAKVEINPQGLYTIFKVELEKKKKKFNLPQVTNKC
jgi:hypothetical protein